MMLLHKSTTTTTITAFSVNTIVDNLDNDDEDSLKHVVGVVESHIDRMLCLTFDAQSRGDILLFDFKKPTHGAHALDIVGDLDRSTFSPKGISIWRDYNFSKTL